MNGPFTHFLHLEVITDIFQLLWVFFNGCFTCLLGLRMAWSNKSQGMYSPYTHSQIPKTIWYIEQQPWRFFNCLIAHFLGFEVIGNIVQQPWMNAHCLIDISWVFKSSGTSVKKLGLMCTNQFHGTCFETSHSFYSHPKVQARVRFYGLPKGILFMLHFHNPHPQVHRQNLRCWLYAKQLKQAQDNHQTYTQKDKLS